MITLNTFITTPLTFTALPDFTLRLDLQTQVFKQEGDMTHEYNPFRNIQATEDDVVNNIKKGQLLDFDTTEIEVDLNNPLTIDVQPSYDGTVNLIINDDKHPPRIINSRFTPMEDDTYKIIDRNGSKDTNIYRIGDVDSNTRLFKTVDKIPYFIYNGLEEGGTCKCGNYIFYLKYSDNDGNETDILAESGVVSVHKGSINVPSSIYGGLAEEVSDKIIKLQINNIDTSFDFITLYYTKTSSDLEGIEYTKAYKIFHNNTINGPILNYSLTGYENVSEIDIEELNIQYNIVDKVKTQTQVQNMLFFGNVSKPLVPYRELEDLSLRILPSVYDTETIGYLDDNYKPLIDNEVEYYDSKNVYYKTGYWNKEIYRVGIVYLMKDDSLSPVFNIRGANHVNKDDVTTKYKQFDLYRKENGEVVVDENNKPIRNYIEIKEDGFIYDNGGYTLENTNGVIRIDYKNDSLNWSNSAEYQGIRPLGLQFTIPSEVLTLLKEQTKGFFFVRQQRIPTVLGQGVAIGLDKQSGLPTLKVGEENTAGETILSYIMESFIDNNRNLTNDYGSRIVKQDYSTTVKNCALICPEINLNKVLASWANGDNFIITKTLDMGSMANKNHYFKASSLQKRHYHSDGIAESASTRQIKTKLTYVPQSSPLVYNGENYFSTRAGIPEEAWKVSCFGIKDTTEKAINLIRGNFCSYVGTNQRLEDGAVYTINTPGYDVNQIKNYFKVRFDNVDYYYSITDRFDYKLIDSDTYTNIDNTSNCKVSTYRGDCFNNKVTTRLHRNFMDPEVPITDVIIDSATWKDNFKGTSGDQDKLAEINRADVNGIQLGSWLTYRVCSSYNLAYRAIDELNVEEVALTGNRRSFYPLQPMSVKSEFKIPESELYNAGYANGLSSKRHFITPNVPYIKNLFDTRIMFSNTQVTDAFKNSYRVFQGLSYKDLTRQYGGIVKLLDWKSNILCIFEHGIGLIAVNERALIQTEEAQNIHIYGAGVLQEKITLISPDYGSSWSDSIIRTPEFVYGLDAYARKIWRYSEEGLEIISDIKVQSFLNERISLLEREKKPIIALRNIKTHYNFYKGDVMFTFYDTTRDATGLENENIWNLCFNEKLNKWITQYSWTPIASQNINNMFYSMDRETCKYISLIDYSLKDSQSAEGIVLSGVEHEGTFSGDLSLSSTYSSYIDNPVFTLVNDAYNQQLVLDGTETELDLEDYTDTILDLFEIVTSDGGYTLKNKTGVTLDKLFYLIKVKITEGSYMFNDYLIIVVKKSYYILNDTNDTKLTIYNNKFQNKFYLHGRAGIFDEVSYTNESLTDQILPTKWYDKQEPFELEFVVSNLTGMHKIFDNICIISNKVQPSEFEFEIIGDVYTLNKAGIYRSTEFNNSDLEWKQNGMANGTAITRSQEFLNNVILPGTNTSVTYDNVINQYQLKLIQEAKDLRTYGRRKGNIQYVEDMWYLVIDPIKFREKYKTGNTIVIGDIKSVKVRDKFLKVRVKYSGEDLAIITAIKTLMTVSYA